LALSLLAGAALFLLAAAPAAQAAPIASGIDFSCHSGCLFNAPSGFVVADTDTPADADGFRVAIDYSITFGTTTLDPSSFSVDPISALIAPTGTALAALDGSAMQLGFGGLGIEFVGGNWAIYNGSRGIEAFGTYALNGSARPIGAPMPEPTAALFFVAGFVVVAETTRRRQRARA